MTKLEKLKGVLKDCSRITIIGHDNSDVDSILSGILLSNLLNFLEIDNEFLIFDPVVNIETSHIIRDMCNIDINNYKCEVEDSTRKFFLVDHYCSMHFGETVACLDHHLTTDSIVNVYPFYYSRISCSTSYMVYELMQEAGYKISKQDAIMILVSMMVDTVSFRSAKTVKYEVDQAKKLAEQFELNYDEIEKYCLCLTPIDKLSVNSIIDNGFKYYTYNGQTVKSSYIQVFGLPDYKVIDTWLDAIIKKVDSNNLVMWVFIIFECKDEISIEYRILKDCFTRIQHKGILSRGTNIMPEIEKVILK